MKRSIIFKTIKVINSKRVLPFYCKVISLVTMYLSSESNATPFPIKTGEYCTKFKWTTSLCLFGSFFIEFFNNLPFRKF
jgi:hypothetical protein